MPSNDFTILDGLSYECLVLEFGQSGQFRRLGYVKFEPSPYMFDKLSVDPFVKHRAYVRDLVRKQFVHGKLPDSVCGVPDQTGRYTVTLV